MISDHYVQLYCSIKHSTHLLWQAMWTVNDKLWWQLTSDWHTVQWRLTSNSYTMYCQAVQTTMLDKWRSWQHNGPQMLCTRMVLPVTGHDITGYSAGHTGLTIDQWQLWQHRVQCQHTGVRGDDCDTTWWTSPCHNQVGCTRMTDNDTIEYNVTRTT